jgi:hypothetical protein
LAAECSVRPVVIVVVLPLAQLVVEEVNVIGDAALVQELVELLVVDAVGPLNLAVEMRRPSPL